MYLAKLIPDWNSLDSVRLAHSRLELASIVFFALLVIAEAIAHKRDEGKAKHRVDTLGLVFFVVAVLCEGAAYPYSQRNDELSEYVIRSLSATAGQAAVNGRNALADSGTALTQAERALTAAGRANDSAIAASGAVDQAQRKIADVNKRADALAYFLSARRVEDESGLENDLRTEYAGKRISFDSYVGDEEAYWLCSQLAAIAGKAGVDSKDECATKPLEKLVPLTDLHIGAPTIQEAQRLSMVLKKQMRVPGHVVTLDVETGLTVTVGVKPSVPLYPMVKKATNKKDAPP